MPVDVVEARIQLRHLSPTQVGMLMLLRQHLWIDGKLPSQDSELATIAGVSTRGWMRARHIMVALFTIDDAGAWRDPGLEAQRDRQLRARDQRARAAAAGGQQLAAQRKLGAGKSLDGMPDAVPPGMPGGTAEATEETDETEAAGLPLGMPGLTSHGSIDRSQSEDLEEIDRSNPYACAGASVPAAVPDDDDPAAPKVPLGVPYGTASGMPYGTAPGTPTMTEEPRRGDAERVLEAVRRACGDKVVPTALTLEGVMPLVDLLHDGCDLKRDIVSVLEDKARASKGPLRTFRATFITDAIRGMRDSRRIAAVDRPSADASPQFFVVKGTPAWAAWEAHEGRSLPSVDKNGKQGWLRPSEFPPGHVPGPHMAPTTRSAHGLNGSQPHRLARSSAS